MNLVSMKRDPVEAAKDSMGACCAPGDPGDMPLYSYGTKVCLNDEDIKKLGIALPVVGSKFMLYAMVEVTSARAEKVQDGAEIGADFQITDMALEPAGGQDPAQSLWPDKE